MRTITLIKVDDRLFIKDLGCNIDKNKIPLYYNKNFGEDVFSNKSTIAHDIFHHSDFTKIGTMADEVEALGAALFLQDRDFVKTRILNQICIEVADLFKYYVEAKPFNHQKIRNKKRKYQTFLQNIQSTLFQEKKFTLSKNRFRSGYKNYTYDDLEVMITDYLETSACLLYNGFIAASKRYQYNFNKAFDNYLAVKNQVEKIINNLHLIPESGELTICYGNGQCMITKKSEHGYKLN